METKMSSAQFEGKSKFKLPEGAEVTKKTVNLSVEEIENGFIIRKSYDIQYQDMSGQNQYAYHTKKWFSKKNPIKIEMEEETPLEDKLD